MENEFLSKILHNRFQLSAECRDYIVQNVKREILTADNGLLLKDGKKACRIWFLEQGSAMQYYYKEEEKKPCHFWKEGDLLTDITSFVHQVSSESCIELLENATLLSLHYDQVHELFQRFPETKHAAKLFMMQYYSNAEQRKIGLIAFSFKERYLQLLQTDPWIVEKTTKENVAGYLGLSRKSLYRLMMDTPPAGMHTPNKDHRHDINKRNIPTMPQRGYGGRLS